MSVRLPTVVARGSRLHHVLRSGFEYHGQPKSAPEPESEWSDDQLEPEPPMPETEIGKSVWNRWTSRNSRWSGGGGNAKSDSGRNSRWSQPAKPEPQQPAQLPHGSIRLPDEYDFDDLPAPFEVLDREDVSKRRAYAAKALMAAQWHGPGYYSWSQMEGYAVNEYRYTIALQDDGAFLLFRGIHRQHMEAYADFELNYLINFIMPASLYSSLNRHYMKKLADANEDDFPRIEYSRTP